MKPTSSLTARALSAVKWNYVGTVGRIVATFVSQIVIARLLGPEQVGLFGYAFLMVTFAALAVEMGLQQALIQARELPDEVVATACGRLLLAGAAAAVVLFLCADLVSQWVFSTPRAAPVLRAMAPVLILNALTFAATAMLSRNLEFKVIQLSTLGAYLVGYMAVGIGAAWLGFGVWSLVLAWYTHMALACASMIWFGSRSIRPGNPLRPLPIAGFGMVVMTTNLLNWVIDNGPHTAIARFFGPAMLGTYSVASNLVKVPADHLVSNLQSILLPLSARAQDNDVGLRRAYLTVLSGVAVVAFPTFTFVAMMAEPIVLLLLGPQWVAAAGLLTALSIAMIVHAVEALCGPMLSGRGEPRVELRLKAVTLLLTLGVLAFTVHHSVNAVAWGVVLVYLFRWIWMNGALSRRLQVTTSMLFAALCGPLLLAGVAAGISRAITEAAGAWAPTIPVAVPVVASAGLIFAIAVALAITAPQWVLGPYLLSLLGQLLRRRPVIASLPGLRRLADSAQRAAS